jgi:DedD protein
MTKREQEPQSSHAWLQRVVGIGVLTVASLLLWPFLADEGPVQMLDTARQIPPAPAVKDYTVEPPKAVSVAPVEPDAVDEDTPAPAPQPSADGKVTASAALTPQGLPQTWVVQVGSFSNQTNADVLKKELQGKGYHVFTKAASDGKGSVRVFVGPKLSRERADSLKIELEQKFKLKPFVTALGN